MAEFACMLVCGPDRRINCGDGIYVPFEDHPYMGACPLGKRGQPIKGPGPRHPFWNAAFLWSKQGKRLTEDGRCIWTPEPKELLKHLGGRHYEIIGYEEQPDVS